MKIETPSRDGTKTYYKLGIMLNNDLGTINCNKEIYDMAQSNVDATLTTVYDDKYQSYSIVNINQLNERSK